MVATVTTEANVAAHKAAPRMTETVFLESMSGKLRYGKYLRISFGQSAYSGEMHAPSRGHPQVHWQIHPRLTPVFGTEKSKIFDR